MDKCYIYMRVSTEAQVDGYSLDAQEKRLEEYAEYKELEISGRYCDAGRSGKDIKGRPEFRRMLEDITSQKDSISCVLVFKLSRFGRNAADVLRSMQILSDYGIDLVSVEEGIDSSTSGGKLMLSLLSAVSEIERENIRAQFLAGKLQSIREGNWGGGPVPYGYRNEEGRIRVEEQEAEVVRQIYSMFLESEATYTSVVRQLNAEGLTRRSSAGEIPISCEFAKRILSNPFYCGRMVYGKSSSAVEMIEAPGNFERIITETDWEKAREKREKILDTYKDQKRIPRINLLAGLVRCPECGRPMVGSTCTKVNRNHGGRYKDMKYYVCKYHNVKNGRICSYNGHASQEKLDAAVLEVIDSLMLSDDFIKALYNRYGNPDDNDKRSEQISFLRKKLHDIRVKQRNLGETQDSLDIFSDDYDEKYMEAQEQIDSLYDEEEETEGRLRILIGISEEKEEIMVALRELEKVVAGFGKLYSRMDDMERRELFRNLIERIEIYPKPEGGRILRSISFSFPVSGRGERFLYKMNCSETEKTAAESKATYAQIKRYVKDRHGVNVSSLYISQVKRKYGILTGKNHNISKKVTHRIPNCPKEKEQYITEALEHFRMIRKGERHEG